MRISVFGLGYVGTVSAAWLACRAHRVTAVDPNLRKVAAINDGCSPVIEPDLDELVRTAVRRAALRATDDPGAAIDESELSFVCVGTPSLEDGGVDLGQLRRCCGEIGAHLRGKPERHVVVVRSTVPPGTMSEQIVPWLEAGSGRRAGADLGVCFQPEFMREGQAIADFEDPPRTVLAASDAASAAQVAGLFGDLAAPLVQTDFATAELIKYVDNAWHALKVGFANEIGDLARTLGIDARALMGLFRLDRKLNLSDAYLAPGLAFGGSCLPKDLRALGALARRRGLDLPIVDAILPSNRIHLERILARIVDQPARRIGVIGLAFKEGTDDLRESPMVELIERLLAQGYEVRVFDPLVDPDAMVGANRTFALSHLPHVARLLAKDIGTVVDHAELLVIGHVAPTDARLVAARAGERRILDCARTDTGLRSLPGYQGLCW